MCGHKLTLNKWGLIYEILIFEMGGRMETGIEFKVSYFDTILNY